MTQERYGASHVEAALKMTLAGEYRPYAQLVLAVEVAALRDELVRVELERDMARANECRCWGMP